MITIIQQLHDWQSMTAAAIAAALAESIEHVDESVYKVTDLVNHPAIGQDAADLIIGTMEAAAVHRPTIRTAITAMSIVGIELGTTARQGLIDQLAIAGSWSAEITAAVKALGRRTITRWESLGGEGQVPDAEAVQAAIDAHTGRLVNEARQVAREASAAVYDAAVVSLQQDYNAYQAELDGWDGTGEAPLWSA